MSGGTRAIFTVYVQFLVSSGVANPVAEGIERERNRRKKKSEGREKSRKGKFLADDDELSRLSVAACIPEFLAKAAARCRVMQR